MGLNDIELNPTLLSEFFSRSLVQTEDADEKQTGSSKTAAEPVSKPIAFNEPAASPMAVLGHNQKGITIIVNYPDVPHLPDAMLEFLTKMLQACKLSLADVAVFNIGGRTDIVAKNITGELKSRIVLLFGFAPLQFGLATQFPEFQVQPLAGITYLHAPPLEECYNDKLVKSKLWVGLQRIFNI